MLVLASLPLPVADIETDLDRAGYSLVAEGWYLNHQGILVGKQQRGLSQDLTDQECFVHTLSGGITVNSNSYLWPSRGPLMVTFVCDLLTRLIMSWP